MKTPLLEVTQRQPQSSGLRAWVQNTFVLSGAALPNEVLHAVPGHSSILHVHLQRNPELNRANGNMRYFTSVRQTASSHTVGGDFITLFAILTPVGAVALLRGAGIGGLASCMPLSAVLNDDDALSLERAVTARLGLGGALDAFNRWLEARLLRRQRVPEAAWRAARVSCELAQAPRTRVADAAKRQTVSPRQLERDMHRWFNLQPKQFALAAQLQRVMQLVLTGQPLSDIALEAGFADQAHMSRTVKGLTGMTPGQLLLARPGPIARAFHGVCAGARVFV
jgi:AraC-like DNA-binding protein